MVVSMLVTLLGSLSYFPTTTLGFGPNHHHNLSWRIPKHGRVHVPSGPSNIIADRTSATILFENKLWDRMEIEEDEEPMWYVLNCVAGLEMDLLRLCRQRCEGMQDVQKFVVPMVTTTRSHGANRMVRDTKVKYQGYVFAKLRLCPETYEAIQGLDLCRSWMGTVNQKGHKKLPPAPVALNEDEIENFGLEDLEAEEPEEPDEGDAILDTAEADQEAADIEETVKKVYKGLRVDDMVKVTAKNKFYNEDAIVRRLKGDKILLRFYTYGSMYEEWMDPGDVRKLDSIEILKGLSGPQRPITQEDIDGPREGARSGRGRDADDQGPRDRRNLQGSFGGGGGPRNRRQDRNAGRFPQDSQYDQKRNDDNWNWYKDNERRNQGGGYNDGDDVEIRGSSRDNQRGSNREEGWVQGDVDSQWGRTDRTSQRQNRRENRQESTQGGDWNAFVSPPKDRPSQDETDDFFASLMTDLSKDLGSQNEPRVASDRNSDSSGLSSTEDDFFASLIAEIEEDTPKSQGKDIPSFESEDRIFASLVDQIQPSSLPARQTTKSRTRKTTEAASNVKSTLSSTEEDFFTTLAKELEQPQQRQQSAASGKVNSAEEMDDFFSGIGAFDDNPYVDSEADDFFAKLEAELQPQLSIDTPKAATSISLSNEGNTDEFPSDRGGTSEAVETLDPTTMSAATRAKRTTKTSSSSPTQSIDISSLDKCTVPVLKEMLREKGLKVSGNKSELIERLRSLV